MKKISTKKPPEKIITTFSEFITELQSIDYIKNKLWFRGVSNSTYKLTPSLFRHKTAKTQSEFKSIEQSLNETFEMRSLPYAESRNWAKDEWERLFFMQHYRVPTRLLDWSGSPLVSMHFAVASIETDKYGNPKSDAAIWILDPIKWNNAVYADTGFNGGILSAKDSWLKRYDTTDVYTSTSILPPVAMRGVHNSARIVAQQGFFTVFGPRPDSMEEIYGSKKDDAFIFPDGCLRKYTIPKAKITSIREEIFSLGVSESTIYPDLEGLAVELKRISGF
jgi:hypothetical protein